MTTESRHVASAAAATNGARVGHAGAREDALRSLFDGTRDPVVVVLGENQALPVRFCLSPHCATLASLLEGVGGWWDAPPNGWRRVVAERARTLPLDVLAVYTDCAVFPRFLTPSLREPAPSFNEQLEEVRSTPVERIPREVRATFGRDVPAVYRSFLDEPSAALDRVCRTLVAYWDRVVRPSWPTIRVFLEREILTQGYNLATRPARDALSCIHPSMRVASDQLLVLCGQRHARTNLGGRSLLLTPLIAARAGVLADFDRPDIVKIGYAAPGASSIWTSKDDARDRDRGLAGLLGRRRAQILAALAQRSTTTMLAAELRLAPATISAHLGVLSRIGLAERMRVGHNVYYQRTERGHGLVTLFG